MHGLEANDPTPTDTFRVINYMLKRQPPVDPGVAAKHMRNLVLLFDPEVVAEAMRLYHIDLAAEKGTVVYTEEGVAYDADDEEESGHSS